MQTEKDKKVSLAWVSKLKVPASERLVRDELNFLMESGRVKAEGATNKRRWLLIDK